MVIPGFLSAGGGPYAPRPETANWHYETAIGTHSGAKGDDPVPQLPLVDKSTRDPLRTKRSISRGSISIGDVHTRTQVRPSEETMSSLAQSTCSVA